METEILSETLPWYSYAMSARRVTSIKPLRKYCDVPCSAVFVVCWGTHLRTYCDS